MALKAIRTKMIVDGLSRNYINDNVGRIKRTFKWATENDTRNSCHSAARRTRHNASLGISKLLADYNTQRVKTGGERVREQMARSKPKAHQQIIAERLEVGRNIVGKLIATNGSIKRSKIGPNKQEFLNAVVELAYGAKKDWPISSRHIHYWLLDIQPLTNSSNGKQRHRYANDEKSTGKLSDILTALLV